MRPVRAFVALELTERLVAALESTGAAVRRADPRWRDEKWVAPRNLHLTLQFLGEMPEPALRDLAEDLGPIVTALPAPMLAPDALCAVPRQSRAAMLWVTFDDPEHRCARLAEAVEQASARYGVVASSRGFRAHATLCRARRPHAVSAEALRAGQEALAAHADVMSDPRVSVLSSRLTPHGPVYSELAAWSLRGE